jgi:hypothetical protein
MTAGNVENVGIGGVAILFFVYKSFARAGVIAWGLFTNFA